MFILTIEAVIFAVLTFFAISYGSLGLLWLLWLFVALDGLLMLFRIFYKFKKRSKKKSSHKQAPTGIPSAFETSSKTKSGLSPSYEYSFADDQPIAHVDETFSMDGHQFEAYVTELYRRLGYKIISTKKSCDQGIDIIVKRFFKTGIQAKCHSRPIGNKAVQEAAAGKRFYRLHKALVLTNGIFTDSAKALAAKNKVVLIDRKQLADMVKKANGRHS